MTSSTVAVGYGVISAKGLVPIADQTLLANVSGATAFPTAVAISAITGETLAVGTTPVSGGTTTRILYDNAGVLGEYTLTGTGTVAVMQNTPTLTTPVLGVATGTSLATSGSITVGPVPASTGNIVLGASATFPNIAFQNGATVRNQLIFDASGAVMLWDFPSGSLRFRDALDGGNTLTIFDAATQNWNYRSGVTLSWNSALFLGRRADANLQLGAGDAAAPVAQTVSVQSVVAGTSNTAGVLWRFDDSAGTGSAASGGFDWYTHPLGTSGTSQNAAVKAMGLSSAGTLSFPMAGSGGTAILIGTTGSGLTLIGNGLELILGNGAGTQNGGLFVGGNQRLSSTSNLAWNNNAANISYITTGTLGVGTGAQGSVAGTLQLATLTASATIATGAPAGSSAGLWKLGALQTAAVILDTTRSIFVDIGGTVYKLMVAQ